MRTEKPNMVFFFTDDQRFDTIRALGNGAIHTPTLDALVARGTVFENGYIMGGTCPAVCMPSRAMLNSGRTLFRIEREGQGIPAEHVTLGEALRAAGYATFGTGKWHNGAAAYARSFTGGDEIYFGGMCDHWNVPAYHFDPTGRYESRHPYCVDPPTTNKVRYRHCDHMHLGRHSTDLFCDTTIAFLREHRGDQPFYAYVSFMAPHDPRTMPEAFRQMYDPAKTTLPPNFMPEHPFDIGWYGRDEQLEVTPRPPDAIRRHIAEYYAMITHVDHEMARVLKVLEETGRAENTIIVFAGDNGLAVGRHGLMGKQSNYDHSVHVPLIMAGPGIPEHERRQAFAYLLDIFPTLCELADVPVPDSVEGKSLVPALRDPRARVRETLYFAYMNLHRAVRDGRYKLIEYVVEGERHTQLFDLHEDPLEMHNLADEPAHAGRLACLRDELLRLREVYGDNRELESAFWTGYSR